MNRSLLNQKASRTRVLEVKKKREERVMRRKSHHIIEKFCRRARERKIDNV